MANVIRLKNYRDCMEDGKGWCEYSHTDKKRVFVALVLGDEPLKITDNSQCLDIDDVILKMAEHIKKERKKKR